MRRLIVLLGLAIAATLVVGRSLAPPVPDGPLQVVTGDPVRVVLPVNASEATIAHRTEAAVAEAAAVARPAMQGELRALAADRSTISHIAETGHARLSSGEAAALAFPWFRTDAGGDRLTIYSVTVELIPGLPGIAVSRDHEDGHGEVNDQLALRCGPPISEELVAAGLRGGRLEAGITQRLQELASAAHEVYHGLVVGAPLGTHLSHARDAAAGVATQHC